MSGNPYEPPHAIAEPVDRVFWRDPLRVMAFVFGLFFTAILAASTPSRFGDVPLYGVLSVLRDVLAAFGVFAYATKAFDQKTNFKIWACFAAVLPVLFAIGLVLDIIDSPMPQVGLFALLFAAFLAVTGPAVFFNIMFAFRLKRISTMPMADRHGISE